MSGSGILRCPGGVSDSESLAHMGFSVVDHRMSDSVRPECPTSKIACLTRMSDIVGLLCATCECPFRRVPRSKFPINLIGPVVAVERAKDSLPVRV